MFLRPTAGGKAILPLTFVMGLAIVAPPVFGLGNAHDVSPAVQKASDLGPVDPDQDITLTVYLNMHNQAAFDQAVDKLYDAASPTYRRWLTDQDLEKYAPTESELETVKQELQRNGLSVLSTDPQGFSIRVHGSAANVEKAFQTQLENLSLNGKVFRAHVQDAKLSGAAGDLVASVAGLDEHKVQPLYKRAIDPKTRLAPPSIPLKKVQDGGGLGAYITDNCFLPPTTYTFTTPGASLPVGVYFGNVYPAGNLLCDFSPSQLEAHYGLPAAYSEGLDGTGQTIVLLEAYGYPTAEADANAFFQLAGLPELTSSNFEIVYPEGVPNPTVGAFVGWDIEIALDIQWSHSIAPGAKILVVVTNGQDSEDFQASMNYIIAHHLGTVVSDSWLADLDLIAGPLEQDSFNSILKRAAAKGISFQFSSGDGGDNGVGTPLGAPGVPSDSPYATAVGGTAILSKLTSYGFYETGWGDDFTLLESDGAAVDPPTPVPAYFGGSGGGESVYFAKPWWQRKLPGTGRQAPDVSALSDPYTGVPIVVTSQGTQYLEPGWGGTSLASPIVTAFLAIATQKAGHTLGQAAPLIAALPSSAITDVLPVNSLTNVSGTVFDSYGQTYYSPDALFATAIYPAQGTFLSAILPVLSDGIAYAIAF